MTEQERQRVLDEEHLRLLRIGYIIMGATHAIFALFPLIYVLMGVGIAAAGIQEQTRPGEPSLAVLGGFFAVFGLIFSLFFVVQAVLQLMTARALGRRRSKVLCQVAAGVSCLQMPWGVVLAVFTFMVLNRESVQQLFQPTPAQLLPPPRARVSLFEDEATNSADHVERQWP